MPKATNKTTKQISKLATAATTALAAPIVVSLTPKQLKVEANQVTVEPFTGESLKEFIGYLNGFSFDKTRNSQLILKAILTQHSMRLYSTVTNRFAVRVEKEGVGSICTPINGQIVNGIFEFGNNWNENVEHLSIQDGLIVLIHEELVGSLRKLFRNVSSHPDRNYGLYDKGSNWLTKARKANLSVDGFKSLVNDVINEKIAEAQKEIDELKKNINKLSKKAGK